jgi:hypothetical protein
MHVCLDPQCMYMYVCMPVSLGLCICGADVGSEGWVCSRKCRTSAEKLSIMVMGGRHWGFPPKKAPKKKRKGGVGWGGIIYSFSRLSS